MLSGQATAEATRAFATTHAARAAAEGALAEDFYGEVALGPADAPRVTISSLGLGTYLGEPDEETDAGYRATTRAALAAGINLLDTAINYRAQASERTLGRALGELVEAGEVERSALVVATKGGFVPQDRDAPARGGAALLAGVPPDEVVQGHCLHPRFLERVLAASRENLRLQTVDVYYLHNPESQLPHVPKPILYERLKRAFAALEAARGRGELGCYGVATWGGLRLPSGDPAALDLSRLLDVARAVGGPGHGLAWVQLPLSLALPEALRVAGQKVGDALLPAIPAARALGLTVVTSGPLAQARLLKQPLPARAAALDPEGRLTPAQRALLFARSGGADCTLFGASRLAHLVEDLGAARRPRLPRAAVLAAAGGEGP